MKLKLPKIQKPTKKQVKAFFIYCLIVIAGNAIASAGASFFIVPNKFVMGGTTGLGIFVRNMIDWYVGEMSWTDWIVNIVVYTANIALFILGAVLLGKKFALATAAGTVLYPAFMSLYNLANDAYHNKFGTYIGMGGDLGDPLLAMIFGSILFGLGIAIVVRVGASTGGTDIPPLILKKFFNWPISITMWVVDFSVVAINMIAPNVGVEEIFYGILITLISSIIIEKISPIGTRRTQVQIISKKYKEIRKMILNKLNRGVTMLRAKSGFLSEDCYVVLTVISNRDLVKLRNEVQLIDPSAFMMVSVISEVRGNGFSTDRIALPKEAEKETDPEPEPTPLLPEQGAAPMPEQNTAPPPEQPK